MRIQAIACAGVSLVLVSGAQAAFFSFASDNDHTSYTFRGTGGTLNNANDPADPQTLLVDDNNGPLAALSFDVNFVANVQLSYLGSSALPLPGKYSHSYNLSGTFSFVDRTTSVPLLTIQVQGGLLTAIGNGNNLVTPTSWDDTAAMQFSDRYGVVTYTWNGPNLPGYGLFGGFSSTTGDDGAFTLTSLVGPTGGLGVSVNPQTGLPSAQWFSEGSFSGQTTIVPAPGAMALAGMATLVLGRRKR